VEGSAKPFKLNQAQHDPKGSYSLLNRNYFPSKFSGGRIWGVL